MDINYYKSLEPFWGNWRIVREIGEGAYGKVFEVSREEFGHKYTSAMKAITIPQTSGEWNSALMDGMDEVSVTSMFRKYVEEFAEEISLMSRFKGHSNVVSYEDHAVIEHKDGHGWDILIRMELLIPMFDVLPKEGSFSRSQAVKLGQDICNAIGLCERSNLIHRDIKPENIFLSEMGYYKLGDFGIARKVEQTTGALSKKGTYSYMAPEVYKEKEYGSTVDIYSLGIVLYRLLNRNRTPFLPPYPETIKFSDRDTALKRRMSGEKIPLPIDAQDALGKVILKACAYDPAQRYQTAADFSDALWRATANDPVSKEPVLIRDNLAVRSHGPNSGNSQEDPGCMPMPAPSITGTKSEPEHMPMPAPSITGTKSESERMPMPAPSITGTNTEPERMPMPAPSITDTKSEPERMPLSAPPVIEAKDEYHEKTSSFWGSAPIPPRSTAQSTAGAVTAAGQVSTAPSSSVAVAGQASTTQLPSVRGQQIHQEQQSQMMPQQQQAQTVPMQAVPQQVAPDALQQNAAIGEYGEKTTSVFGTIPKQGQNPAGYQTSIVKKNTPVSMLNGQASEKVPVTGGKTGNPNDNEHEMTYVTQKPQKNHAMLVGGIGGGILIASGLILCGTPFGIPLIAIGIAVIVIAKKSG